MRSYCALCAVSPEVHHPTSSHTLCPADCTFHADAPTLRAHPSHLPHHSTPSCERIFDSRRSCEPPVLSAETYRSCISQAASRSCPPLSALEAGDQYSTHVHSLPTSFILFISFLAFGSYILLRPTSSLPVSYNVFLHPLSHLCVFERSVIAGVFPACRAADDHPGVFHRAPHLVHLYILGEPEFRSLTAAGPAYWVIASTSTSYLFPPVFHYW